VAQVLQLLPCLSSLQLLDARLLMKAHLSPDTRSAVAQVLPLSLLVDATSGGGLCRCQRPIGSAVAFSCQRRVDSAICSVLTGGRSFFRRLSVEGGHIFAERHWGSRAFKSSRNRDHTVLGEACRCVCIFGCRALWVVGAFRHQSAPPRAAQQCTLQCHHGSGASPITSST
jgi:hypothetical protein